jgi:hypothetical protein
MTSHPFVLPYVSITIGLPAPAAGARLAQLTDDPSRRALASPGGVLILSGMLPPTPPRSTWWPAGTAVGTLASGLLGVRIPVELEVLPWSEERAELGLRARVEGRALRAAIVGRASFVRAATYALAQVGAAIAMGPPADALSAQPQRAGRQVFTAPSHGGYRAETSRV